MTDLVPVTANDVFVVPFTGELIDLTDPNAVARNLKDLREHEQTVRDAKAILTDALVQHSQRVGSKTLHLEGVGKVELTGGPDSVLMWDMDVLELLREEGLPEERWNQLVRVNVSYTVNSSVAKSIAASNPRYAEIIDVARQRADKPWSARVA